MDIETRFESLERKLRLHKRLWMGAACLLTGALVLGATRPVPKVIVAEEIVAERFIVKDASGREVSAWGVGKDGEVALGMTEGSKPRLAIAVTKKHVGMFISDTKGKLRFTAGIFKAKSQKEPFP